jgi:hypothetical protein
MLNIQKLRIIPVLVLIVLASGACFGSNTAYAAPNDVAQTQKYCKSQMPKGVDAQCTKENMNQIRAAFADQCDGKNSGECIENAAENVIDQIKGKNPKNAQGFNDALDAAIKDNKQPACNGSECTNTPTGQGRNCDDSHCDLVALYVNPAINLLSVLVGLVVAASLIAGGIQYTASSGDPQKTSAAKSRIQNTLLAFLAYAFLYAFLNFLIPGGLFG